MFRVYVEFDNDKKYYYNGNDFIQAIKAQAELVKKYKNQRNVVAIGYEH